MSRSASITSQAPGIPNFKVLTILDIEQRLVPRSSNGRGDELSWMAVDFTVDQASSLLSNPKFKGFVTGPHSTEEGGMVTLDVYDRV